MGRKHQVKTARERGRAEPSTAYLWGEWAVLFVVLPLIAFTELFTVRVFYFYLPAFIYCGIIFSRHRWPPPRPQQKLQPWWFILRTALAFAMLAGFTLCFLPERWLAFPKAAPGLFLMVMGLYPLVSAWPQEFVFRRFYFARYEKIFPSPAALLHSNAAVFCLLHLMYDNWIALAFTLAGGYLFALTFRRTGSLAWVWLEHALYGQWIFAIGLGSFFYEGP